jgi:hypothetical protein
MENGIEAARPMPAMGELVFFRPADGQPVTFGRVCWIAPAPGRRFWIQHTRREVFEAVPEQLEPIPDWWAFPADPTPQRERPIVGGRQNFRRPDGACDIGRVLACFPDGFCIRNESGQLFGVPYSDALPF